MAQLRQACLVAAGTVPVLVAFIAGWGSAAGYPGGHSALEDGCLQASGILLLQTIRTISKSEVIDDDDASLQHRHRNVKGDVDDRASLDTAAQQSFNMTMMTHRRHVALPDVRNSSGIDKAKTFQADAALIKKFQTRSQFGGKEKVSGAHAEELATSRISSSSENAETHRQMRSWAMGKESATYTELGQIGTSEQADAATLMILKWLHHMHQIAIVLALGLLAAAALTLCCGKDESSKVKHGMGSHGSRFRGLKGAMFTEEYAEAKRQRAEVYEEAQRAGQG